MELEIECCICTPLSIIITLIVALSLVLYDNFTINTSTISKSSFSINTSTISKSSFNNISKSSLVPLKLFYFYF